jgi:alpha-1,6-mannosyltransferase
VRGVLGLVNALSLISFRNAVSHTFGSTAATWYMILQTSQFHVMYYASRTLPNMFAFALSEVSMLPSTVAFILMSTYSDVSSSQFHLRAQR